MVVAPGTAEAQAEEHVAGDVGDVVQDDLADLADLALVVLVDPVPEEPGRHQGLEVAGRDLVAGKLLEDEPIVRHVVVERADDVVAIPPGLGPIAVGAVAVRLGVAHQVEPVPGPALAVARARQQPVDQRLVGSGGRSARNASTSSRVGGSPVRSYAARRIKARRSASGAG